MKRNRIIYLIAWVLSLIGISFYGGPVSYGLFFMLTFLPVVSLLYLICVFVCFRVYQEAQTRYPTANHAVPFFFTLVNEFHFGYVGIRIRLFSSFSTITDLDDGVIYELHPGSQIKKETHLVCRYRGEYEVGIKEFVIEDYFRLIRLHYRNREAMRVVVRPDLIELAELKNIDPAWVTSRETQGKQTLPDILVREYEPGDDVRLINWRLTAQTGKPLVRGRIGEDRETAVILLGTERSTEDMRQYLPVENKMLETVLALSLFLVKKNTPVRTVTCAAEPEIRSADSLTAFDAYYQEISGISFRENTLEKQLLQRAGDTGVLANARLVVMILQGLCAEALDLAAFLADSGTPVVICRVCNAQDLPEEKTGLARTEIIDIPADADLREVL